jgi:hypothetical protein
MPERDENNDDNDNDENDRKEVARTPATKTTTTRSPTKVTNTTDRLAVSSTEQRRAESACLANGKVNETPCWICGQPIDYTLRPRHHRAAAVHSLDTSADPDPDDLVLAHRQCAEPQQPSSRRW